jgi:manganese/iron transport system ATP-binding protein
MKDKIDAWQNLAAAGNKEQGIIANDIVVTYRNGHTALTGISFAIPKGSITALVGMNGSGKSTLFKALMGFVSLAHGNVEVLGLPVKESLRRNLVAYVPQSEDVDWNFPILVEDVVMMGRYGHMNFWRHPKAGDREAVEQALKRVNMYDFRHRQIGELSGGQKKRVFLARALAQGARVVLLDEPFTGVDVTTEQQIVKLLCNMRQEGRVILVSTHNLGSVPEFCDRAILINRSVIAAGPIQEVFTQSNLEKAFGGVLRHFVLEGPSLHVDDDKRKVTILTDDERPFVSYGDSSEARVLPLQTESSDSHD